MADLSRRIVAVIVVTALAAGLAACSPKPAQTTANPFAASSPWRQLLSSDPTLDPNSEAMIAAVQAEPGLHANLVAYGVPIYNVTPGTPSYTVNCTAYQGRLCPFAGWPVLIPDGAAPNSGSDGAMVTIDEATATIFEFWRAVKNGDGWSASFGAVNSLRGSGWGGQSTGSGASRLGGVIRIAEIKSGTIPHALALQSTHACTSFRPPALKSDGTSSAPDCLPEGARVQLDPALDLSKLNLSPGELAVATAMQRYGGYVMDVSAAPLSVSFELDTAAAAGTVGEVYTKAGFRWDYDAMEHVPWEKLRVLK